MSYSSSPVKTYIVFAFLVLLALVAVSYLVYRAYRFDSYYESRVEARRK